MRELLDPRLFRDLALDVARVLGALAAVAAPIVILAVHVSNQYRVVELGYDVAAVTREHRQLIERQKKLRLEAAVQGRASRLTDVARRTHGLVPAKPSQILIVDVVDVSRAHGDAPVVH